MAADARTNPPDVATRALYAQLCAKHAAFIAAADGASECDRALRPRARRPLSLALVPGIFYSQHPETGADGALLEQLAAELAIPFQRIPIDGRDGLAAGAEQLACWLRRNPAPGTRILVSLSKGSAEVAELLTRPAYADCFNDVAVWLSVSGLPLGSHALEASLDSPLRSFVIRAACRLKGWDLDAIRSLLQLRAPEALVVPAHLTLVQVAAFPERAHLRRRRCRRLHRRLSCYGPNDGFALLDDLARLPGHFYPLWGSDHYLEPRAMLKPLLRGLLRLIVNSDLDVPRADSAQRRFGT